MLDNAPRGLAPLLVLLAATAGCDTKFAGNDTAAPELEPNVDSEFEQTGNLDDEFARTAADFAVPVTILQAIAWEMTTWQMIDGDVEFEGRPERAGIMGVPESEVADLASRLGVSEDTVRTDRETNLRAGAMRLTELANGLGIDRADVAAWAPAVALYADIEGDEGRAAFVHDGVYRAVNDGVFSELGTLPASSVDADYRMPTSGGSGGDSRGAIWRPSPNNSARPSGASGDPTLIIIHTCEGSYSGCWSWLTNSRSGVSAHYVVNNDGTEVSQLVSESRKAWHIGATYDSNLNSGTASYLSGSSSNNFTIGIEHAGYASQSTWSSGLIDRSSELVCDIAADWDIPIDRYHVVGHGQLQPYNRVDPGSNWPWSTYLSMANGHCGAASSSGGSGSGGSGSGGSGSGGSSSGGGSGSSSSGSIDLVIDSNSTANPADAEIEVSRYWTASNNVSGYWNTGYWWRSTASSSDVASFWFYLDSPGRITADAWWSSAGDRSRSAPFLAMDEEGNVLGRATVDQSRNGSRWVELGTFDFPAGWNRIALSRWTTPGYIVVADAVRVRSAE